MAGFRIHNIQCDAGFRLCIHNSARAIKERAVMPPLPGTPTSFDLLLGKLHTVRSRSSADVSLERHCNKMNCHCFPAELYKLPHQSHNMGPPPLAINQWEGRRRHQMRSHFLKLRGASVADKCCCLNVFPWGDRQWRPSGVVKARCSSIRHLNLLISKCRL